ncbi:MULTISPECIES: SDR family NAD(P)-dependent oxidoreductase [Hymenobacter]|uniref:SDR family oxidoreductase n=1 Tax=Hymenobacter jejuensis TaxID=2502781 RepID=A0A5B7ZXQ0_9BACT|nr:MULTISPECIES: SDR family oxidoreductase [Hymenobacter]MBC6991435.1 SDR family oxidoreductase [Hymenobacter sp. BT491]QDA59770.1 SDR family oxidoreductase [Hymenobacter jejuensis]
MAKDPNLSVALVTGAASGIGQELAHLLAKDQYQLILVDQNPGGLQGFADHLQSVHHIQPTLITQDLSQPGAAQRVYDEVKNKGLQVDILVNDAGFGLAGPFLDADINRHVAMINTNITALMELTFLFGRDMKQRNKGRILQLASLASFQPNANLAVYGATKAFVLSFTEAITAELQDSGVTITALCPGATETEFFVTAHAEDTKEGQSKKADPKDVAKDGYEALMSGEPRVISGVNNKVMATITNVVPDKWLAAMSKKQFEPAAKQ